MFGKGSACRQLLFSFGSLCHAQSTPEDEYKKLIRVNEDIQPLGEHPFGENISLYDGSLSFTQTDVSLAGTGPLLQLVRQFDVEGDQPSASDVDTVFGDWRLVLPHLETLIAGIPPSASNPTGLPMWNSNPYTQLPQKINGWQIDNFSAPGIDLNARCSHFDVPPTVIRHLGDPRLQEWDPEEWWKGYHLVLPGESGQDMLSNVDAATNSTYPVVTKSHWRFSCLPSTANGQPGDAFLGQAPDGTKYWFDMLVYRGASGMSRQLDGGTTGMDYHPSSLKAFANTSVETLISLLSGSTMAHAEPVSDNMLRSTGVLLVTKIQDRFGNTLNYSYDANGYLTGITASDGRALSVTYVPGTTRIQTVTLQPSLSAAARTWTYSYIGGSLTDVKLPDNSHWQYDLSRFVSVRLSGGSTYSSCITLGLPVSFNPTIGTVTHPSGLVGQFTVQPMKHGRSYVRRACGGMYLNNPDTYGSYALAPDAWYSLTAKQMTISGAGIPSQTWSYNYSLSNDSWSDCTGSCPTTIWSDVVAPDGSAVRHIFSNQFGMTESQLLRTEYYAGAAGSSTLLRAEDNAYAPPTTAPLPTIAGNNLQTLINADQTEKYSPLNQRVITQYDISTPDTYTWQAEAFNAYAQVTETKRSNSIAGQSYLEETTSYLNDTSLWVLGLPEQVTNVATGEVESLNTYDPSNDTLQSRARFGQTLMHYTFNSAGQPDAGQLASFTDGNSHTTSLSNYKRGIPQTIGYPDNTSETLTVDDFGQISAITDQAKHTTSYFYDGGGRVNEIDYPANDEQPWLKTLITTAPVPGDERGLAGPHWKRTTTTGNAVGVTYFDAMLRPVLSDSEIGTSVIASTLTTYDAKGQKSFGSYPSATALTFTQNPAVAGILGIATQYDALGRTTKVLQDSELGTLTSSTAYLSGARQQVTDPNLNVTTTSYQVFDTPSYNTPMQVQAPAGITQTVARDIYGNPLSITQSGPYGATETDTVTKTLTYDSYHRLCRTTEPESGSTVLHYDAANNLDLSAAGLTVASGCGQELLTTANQTKRTYDPMNRVWTILPPVGTQSTQYHYTPLGQPDKVVSGISTWNGAYNYRGMLTGESLQLVGQGAWGIGYAHDASGNLSLMQYPDGENVSYAPDALGRSTQVGSYANGIAYYPNGQVHQFVYGNGTAYVALQNARRLVSNFSYGPGSIQLSEDLAYDANGNITTVTDEASGPRSKAFRYDPLNRLTSATAAGLWGTQAYTYDALNNLRTLQTGSQTSIYNYDTTNKLANISSAGTTLATYQYDNRGNVTGKNAATLVFDQKNQLTQITGSDTYAYDPFERRVSKTAGGTTTYYFYSHAGQLLYQVDPVALTSTNFIYLGTKLIARDGGFATHVVGNVDGVSIDGSNNASVNGWACSTSVAASINVELFAGGPSGGGGTRIATATANLASEPAVAAICLTSGTTYRFSIPLTTAQRTMYANALIYMYGDSPVGAGNLLLFDSGVSGVPVNVPTSAPVLSVPAISGNGSYTVSWASVSGATSYTLQERVNGGIWSIIQTGSALSKALTGKAAGTYGYQAQGCNAGVCGPWSSVANTTVVFPPAAPATITVPPTSSGSVAVSWAASTGATSYTLQHRLGSGIWAIAYSGTATSSTVTETASGSYTYQVEACDAGGCSAFTVSSAVTVTLPPASAPALTVPATSNSGSYTVSWSGVSGATSYTLKEQVNGGVWTPIQSSSSTSDALSGKGNGSYAYQAQACNSGGCGPWSGVVTTSVLLVPATPTGLMATIDVFNLSGALVAQSAGTVTPQARLYAYQLSASWAASTGATSYTFQYCKSGGTCSTPSGSATSVSGLTVTGTAYSVSVQACNASGCSAYSAAVTPNVVQD